MGYRINYSEDRIIRTEIKQKNMNLLFVPIILFLTVITARLLWPEQTSQVLYRLFPWSQQQVMDAFQELALDLTQGQPIKESVKAFCQEILYHGSY